MKTIALLVCFLSVSCTNQDRARDYLQSPHAISNDKVAALSTDEFAQLFVIARDPQASLYERVRAVGLVGSRGNTPEAEALWQEMRHASERELRIQAAYAQATAQPSDTLADFIQTLLADPDRDMREVGIRSMFVLQLPQAQALAEHQLNIETDNTLKLLLKKFIARLVTAPKR
jgi:hypothetical protein